MKPQRPRSRKGLTALLFAAGFLLNFLACYPGFVPPDGWDMYAQALSGQYTDWHPPIMALFWRFLLNFWKGPQPVLLLQLGMLWLSGYLLWRSLPHWSARLLLTLLLVLAPWVQNFAGSLLKDVHMAFSYLLATALMLRAALRSGRFPRAMVVAVFLLLAYGTLVRINALPAVFPLLLLWLRLCFPTLRWYGTAAGLAGSVLLLFALNRIFNSALAKPQHRYPEAKLFLHDLLGIYARSGAAEFPALLYTQPDFDTAGLRAAYTPATFDDSWWSGGRTHTNWALPEQPGLLQNAWAGAIRQHPAAYLQHRGEGYLYYLQLRSRSADYHPWYPWIHPNEYGFELKPSFLREAWLKPVQEQLSLPWMRPPFWMLLNVLLLLPALRLRNRTYRRFAAALLLSGLLYQLPAFFVFQTDTDFRYFYWNCVAVSLAGILCLYKPERMAGTGGVLPKTS